jgi:hypothetical protein
MHWCRPIFPANPIRQEGEEDPTSVPESSYNLENYMMTDTYEPGDYVKVEFPALTTGIGEWMWVRVTRRDDEKQIVFGTLDNEPVGDYGGRIELGSELAVSYAQIREHRRRADFGPRD